MIVNGSALLQAAPIKNMATQKQRSHGVSWGLAEAGYDIRIKQSITFAGPGHYHYVPFDDPDNPGKIGFSRKALKEQTIFRTTHLSDNPYDFRKEEVPGRFVIASTIEEFDMPDDLVGVVHDKSTWARQGLSVFNTVIEPGWKGFLTLELVFHGNEKVVIPAGSGIAQVIFTSLAHNASYEGKYQNQADMPIPSVFD